MQPWKGREAWAGCCVLRWQAVRGMGRARRVARTKCRDSLLTSVTIVNARFKALSISAARTRWLAIWGSSA